MVRKVDICRVCSSRYTRKVQKKETFGISSIESCYPDLVQLQPVVVSMEHLNYAAKIPTVTGFVGECSCTEMLVCITKWSSSAWCDVVFENCG